MPQKLLPRPQDVVIIKVTRFLREHIARAARGDENIDMTLSRLLGLRRPGAGAPQNDRPRAPRRNALPPSERPPVTTIKISRRLLDHITQRAGWNESIDHTIRRLLGLASGANGSRAARRRP